MHTYRQGDVLQIAVDDIVHQSPKGGNLNTRIVLAYGGATTLSPAIHDPETTCTTLILRRGSSLNTHPPTACDLSMVQLGS